MIYSSKEIDKNNIISKTLKEYFSFKDEFADYIILFQIGAFYETFFEDAKILSTLAGLAQGTRSFSGVGPVLQAGTSEKSINSIIKILLENNYKICKYQEFSDENDKKIRKLTRIYTKGTIVESEFLDTDENNYLLSLLKTEDYIELSYADVSTGQFYETKGCSEEISLEIEKIEPKEIIFLESQKNEFKNLFNKYNITLLNNCNNCTKTEELILEYCKSTQLGFCTKLEKIKSYDIKNYLIMDETTRRNLELTRTKSHLKKKGSLFWFLNDTKTPMGARLLKKYLDEPLLDVNKITKRQNAILELTQKPEKLYKLKELMTQFCDLSRICTKISNSTILPKDLYQIAINAQALGELKEICSEFNSDLLKIKCTAFSETINFIQEVKKALNPNTPNELKSGGIINDGYFANLDFIRNEISNAERKIKNYEAKERKNTQINNLKIDLSRIIGYYIEIPASKISKAPNNYIKKQGLTNCSRYTTQELQAIEQELFNLKFQANELEYELYCQLRTQSTHFIDSIRQIAKDIAKIDIFASLASCALENKLTMPTFNQAGIYIKNGFHPSLIKLKNEITKNDTAIDNGSLIVLTGANMSGKSTYLKYNALILLLAQIGSFVPAEFADLTIIDKLFMRQGSTDDIINNNSSFMVEMNDLKFILDNITDSSFVLLDEPAKSTNAKEGGAISRAFCEYLLANFKTKTIIATHNCELTKIEKQYSSKAFNYVIGNPNTTEETTIDRKIRKGVMNTSLAINTAKLANLPKELIKLALNYAQ